MANSTRKVCSLLAAGLVVSGCHHHRRPIVSAYDTYPAPQYQYQYQQQVQQPAQAQSETFQPQPAPQQYSPSPAPEPQEPPAQQTGPETDDAQPDTSVTSSVRMGLAKLASNVQRFTIFLYGSDATIEQCKDLVKGSYDFAAWIAKNSSDSSDEEQRWFVKILKDAASDEAKDILARNLCDPDLARAAH